MTHRKITVDYYCICNVLSKLLQVNNKHWYLWMLLKVGQLLVLAKSEHVEWFKRLSKDNDVTNIL